MPNSYGNIPKGDLVAAALTVTRVYGSAYTVHLEIRQEGDDFPLTAFDQV